MTKTNQQDTEQATYIEYIDFLLNTKWYAHADHNDSGELSYMALGLAGEAGEFVDIVKKVARDHGYMHHLVDLSPELIEKMRDELGDVLWYLTQLANILGLTIPELMSLNMRKLRAREANGGKGRQHVK